MFIKRLGKIVTYPFSLFYKKINPVDFARMIGVNFSVDLHVYGDISWGTEPWIIKIGTNVHLTDGIQFITHDGGTLLFRKYQPDLEITKPITIGNDVYIGTRTTLLPGVTIGNNVIIGACSVVTRDIPNDSVAVGVPAKVIKTVDNYFEKIKDESLHLGHLKGKVKDNALRKYYNYQN